MRDADSPTLGRPLWYELMTTDPAAAQAFYTAVVGWQAFPFGNTGRPYTMFHRDPAMPIAGLLERPDAMKAPPFWSMYIGAPDLDASCARARALGARECSPVIQVPSIGRMQLLADPQGAWFYAFEPLAEDFPPEGPAEVGDVAWIELCTTDVPGAMAFYSDLFAWTPGEISDLGPDGHYQVFHRPRAMIGGMMNTPPSIADAPPHWRVYFRVADLDAAVEQIKARGGRLLSGPEDISTGGRIVNAVDPQGAAFSLFGLR